MTFTEAEIENLEAQQLGRLEPPRDPHRTRLRTRDLP